ncbi:hypothetical protein GALL_181290 [mine drainage metagenome]|uniref:Uncharacterized protein n=1 Tax=mine drainage metagenome TaxID=410659 RepID=A0A1J5S689_9ZZZZ
MRYLVHRTGMSRDDDPMMKCWVTGCRNFRIVGASCFYHFDCKNTGRIFVMK